MQIDLPRIGLDQRVGEHALALRRGGGYQKQRQRRDRQHRTEPAAPKPRGEQPGPGKQHDQPGQGIGAKPRRQRREMRIIRRSERQRAQRVPWKAGEYPAAQPFAKHPAPGHGQHQRGASSPAQQPPAEHRKTGPDREVKRQADHRDPAHPDRHRRLIGECGGNPVEPDDEVRGPKQPAQQPGITLAARLGQQFQLQRQRGQRHRPQAKRGKAGGCQRAKHQRQLARVAKNNLDRALAAQGSAHRFERFAGIASRRLAPHRALARLGFALTFAAGRNRRGQRSRIESGRLVTLAVVLTRAAVIALTPRPQPAARTLFADKRIFGRLIGIAVVALFSGHFSALGFVLALFTLLAPRAFLARRAVVARLVEIGKIAAGRKIAGILAFAAIVLPAFALRAAALFFLALALIGNHPEIVIGKLQVVFRLNPIAIEMGVLGQLAVFLQQLRRIAAGPAVDPVELLAATAAVLAITAAAPTVIPTSIVQRGTLPNCAAVRQRRAIRPQDLYPVAPCDPGSDICQRVGQSQAPKRKCWKQPAGHDNKAVRRGLMLI